MSDNEDLIKQLTKPIVGIGARNAGEVFHIMVDRIRFRLSSPPPQPHVVGIKPLEWVTLDNGTAWSKSTPIGLFYHATHDGWMLRNGSLNPTDGVEAAKAFAQADYETRIRAALSAEME